MMKEPVLSQGILDVVPHTDAHRKWVWFMCLLSDFLAPKSVRKRLEVDNTDNETANRIWPHSCSTPAVR